MSVMKLPANYAVINEEEMVYLDGVISRQFHNRHGDLPFD